MSVKTLTSFVVVCDKCGFAGYLGESPDDARQLAGEEGWVCSPSGEDVCDYCKGETNG